MPATAPTSTDATPTTAMYMTACMKRSLWHAERLFADIPPEKFCYRQSPNMNHPAFIVGHLSLYPNRIVTLIGREDLITDVPAGWLELFQAGSVCGDDASKYPKKDALTKVFFDGYRKVAEILPGVDDEVFRRDNPLEGRMREVFPKVGIAVNFLCNNHLAMHLGQISTWRRTIGLGPVM